MAQRSKIAKLPKNLRTKVDSWLAEEGRTVDDFVTFVNELLQSMGRPEKVSRSGAHRYLQSYERVVEDMRKSRMLAEALVKPLGEAGEERVSRLNIELAHTLVMKLMLGDGEEPVRLDAKEAMFVGQALKSLTSAQRDDANRTLQLRKTFAAEAATAAVTEATARGLSAETVEAIRHAVLGMAA